jgi:outer membrane immunogenic protein
VGCVPAERRSINETVEINSFGTVRARFGAAIDSVLLYDTPGLAWTNAKDSLDAAAGGLTLNVISLSATKVGWTVGAGAEIAFGGGFSGKIEYLYIATDALSQTAAFPTALGGGTITESANIRDSIVRAGINYRF